MGTRPRIRFMKSGESRIIKLHSGKIIKVTKK